MLYTRKGDGGTTKTLHCDQRLSKSSAIAEALGALDELNSLLGLVKIKYPDQAELILGVQQNLFIVQAELAGAEGKTIVPEKVLELEKIIDGIEKELPPIKSFFISGGTELAAFLDWSRTVARRAERRVVKAKEEKLVAIGEFSLAYLNRLSSLLYALARLVNHKSGITEQPPSYR
ncbi:MAG: cob(I)yrinic acid a,c-diamide adenosyltransferase [Patescibacteria group bacterium]